ncbi:MAG: prepilin-type N-terminal cleavage/methylation domain-containing protein [bacterium]|nr:prepilin-type N-terminal cleavage/methylation domain-containing protein [bacterium]
MRRSGFTLLELMLVLAIMVLLGAIAAPRLTDVFERQKLSGAASNMRLAWDEARLKAMKTGQAQVFSCTLGTGDYQIQPLMLQSDISNAGAGAEVMVGGAVVETQSYGTFQPANVGLTGESDTEKLEDDIVFLSCSVSGDMRAYTVAQDAQSQSSGISDLNTQSVSQRVVFYPDGSTSTAEVQLQNKRGEIRAIRIRGLTGHSQIVALKNVASGVDADDQTTK